MRTAFFAVVLVTVAGTLVVLSRPDDSTASAHPPTAATQAPPASTPVTAAASTATTTPSPTVTPGATHTHPAPRATRAGSGSGRWRPKVGLTWQWQLSGTIDPTVGADVYDVDLFTTSAATVAQLHRHGRRVICYVNVGAYESYRPDAGRFPEGILGAGDGWDSERWLDIRRTDVLEPIMAARFDLCRSKGFDGVEPDLTEAWTNDSGFPVTAGQQLTYNRLIASLAHERNLAVGLKNDLEQIGALVGSFDFAVNEQCVEYDECDLLKPFIDAGKPVFHTEYDVEPDQFCPVTEPLEFASLYKRLDLDAWRQTC